MSTCRRPATRGRRGCTVTLRDLVWETIYAPIANAGLVHRRTSSAYLQFLTIRQFLSLVFAALVGLLFLLMLVMLVWS